MVETTSFQTRKRIGTVGTIGRGVEAIVLRALDVETGTFFNRFFTYGQVEELGLLHVPIGSIVVPVRSVALGCAHET